MCIRDSPDTELGCSITSALPLSFKGMPMWSYSSFEVMLSSITPKKDKALDKLKVSAHSNELGLFLKTLACPVDSIKPSLSFISV